MEPNVLLWESRKLDKLSQSTSQLSTEVKASFSTVSSKLTSTESTNRSRHHEVLAHLNDHAKSDNLNIEKLNEVSQQQVRSMDVNEAGFRAVHSSLITASSSSAEEHKTTHAILNQCQGQLQQILRDRITFGKVGHSIYSPPTRPKALNSATTETTVFWGYSFHRLPIGMLQICLHQTRRREKLKRSAAEVCAGSEIVVTFVPPRWLSRIAIEYSMSLNWDLISSQWRWGATLRPLTVNYNQFFVNAVHNIDVEGVRKSFAEGLAKPTDYVLLWNRTPWPWYYVGLQSAFISDVLNSSCSLCELV